jgi:hypothetical protein
MPSDPRRQTRVNPMGGERSSARRGRLIARAPGTRRDPHILEAADNSKSTMLVCSHGTAPRGGTSAYHKMQKR